MSENILEELSAEYLSNLAEEFPEKEELLQYLIENRKLLIITHLDVKQAFWIAFVGGVMAGVEAEQEGTGQALQDRISKAGEALAAFSEGLDEDSKDINKNFIM